MINPGYEVNDEDIESVLNWLQLHRPQQATRENAESILEKMYAQLHVIDKLDPEFIERLANEL